MADGRVQKINSLEAQIRLEKAKLKNINVEFTDISRRFNDCKHRQVTTEMRIEDLESKLKTIKNCSADEPIVSEHALVRFVERVIGIPRTELIERMITKEASQLILKIGTGKIPVTSAHGTYRLVVKNGIVVTVEEP